MLNVHPHIYRGEVFLRSTARTFISLFQVRNELLAVGANDPYVRIYDRRKIKTQDVVTVRVNDNKD